RRQQGRREQVTAREGRMRIVKIIAAGALAACMAGAPRVVAADEIKDIKTVARATAAKAGKAVVTVKVVVKLKLGGREQEEKLEAVPLKARGRAPELLEDIFTVTRLDRGEGRATAVVLGSVKAVVKGPRTFYVCTSEVSNATQGCIAYAADGAPLGIFVVKVN